MVQEQLTNPKLGTCSDPIKFMLNNTKKSNSTLQNSNPYRQHITHELKLEPMVKLKP